MASDSQHTDPIIVSGPRRGDVLTLQDTHRSRVIWEEPLPHPLECRRADRGFWNLCPLDIRVQQHLITAGFYGVYRSGEIQLDHALITSLVERWRQETHSFHLPVGEATVTLQDVSVIWGLPIDGEAVIGTDSYNTIKEWQDLCLELLGYMPSPDDFRGNELKIISLTKYLNAHPLTAESTPLQVLSRARCHILQLLGGCVMGGHSGTRVKLIYLPLLRDIEAAGRFSWGSATLATLYRGLCRASHEGVKEIYGPLVMLQIWAWERMPMFRPARPHEVPIPPDGSQMLEGPRGCLWDVSYNFSRVATRTLIAYRDQLDYMRENQFIWEPYSANDIDRLPFYCLKGRDIWCAAIPLINFDVVEFHLPHRVLRQFGFQQNIPMAIDTSTTLHRTDRRGRGGTNWVVYHRQHLNTWNSRRQHIVDGIPIVGPLSFLSEYMIWYRDITRLLIGNPIHRFSEEFKPSAPIVEVLGQCLSQLYFLSLDTIEGSEDNFRGVIGSVRDLCERALVLVGEERRIAVRTASTFGVGETSTGPTTTSSRLPIPDTIVPGPSSISFNADAETISFDSQLDPSDIPTMSFTLADEHLHTEDPYTLSHVEAVDLSHVPRRVRVNRRRPRVPQHTSKDVSVPLALGSDEGAPQIGARKIQPRRNTRHPPCGT